MNEERVLLAVSRNRDDTEFYVSVVTDSTPRVVLKVLAACHTEEAAMAAWRLLKIDREAMTPIVPRYPPRCSACGRELRRAEMVGVGYEPCNRHPYSRVVYRLQEPRLGYPAGWPLCTCGEPLLDGKATCGDARHGSAA